MRIVLRPFSVRLNRQFTTNCRDRQFAGTESLSLLYDCLVVGRRLPTARQHKIYITSLHRQSTSQCHCLNVSIFFGSIAASSPSRLSERTIPTRLNYASLSKSETLTALFETSPVATLCYACHIRHRLNSVYCLSPNPKQCRLPLLLTDIGKGNMAQQQNIHHRPLEPHVERTIRIALRTLGFFALGVCLLFWFSLLWC